MAVIHATWLISPGKMKTSPFFQLIDKCLLCLWHHAGYLLNIHHNILSRFKVHNYLYFKVHQRSYIVFTLQVPDRAKLSHAKLSNMPIVWMSKKCPSEWVMKEENTLLLTDAGATKVEHGSRKTERRRKRHWMGYKVIHTCRWCKFWGPLCRHHGATAQTETSCCCSTKLSLF